MEVELAAHPARALATARVLALYHFPQALVGDVLTAAGLNPGLVLRCDPLASVTDLRQRSRTWRAAVVEAWHRSCAFCGWDGQLGGAPVGLDAARVRWFAYDGRARRLAYPRGVPRRRADRLSVVLLGRPSALWQQAAATSAVRTAAGRCPRCP